MSDFNLSTKQQNRVLKILMAVLLVFVILIASRYFLGVKTLKKSENYIESLKNFFQYKEETLENPVERVSDPKLGNALAAHRLFIFADFQCSYCAEGFAVLSKLVEAYPDKVLIIWKDMVNSAHPQAQNAAVAARCAQAQNKFWEYSAALFAGQTALGENVYSSLAEGLGLNKNQFSQCLANKETLPLVEESNAEGRALGVNATPYFFIDGLRVEGSVSFEELEKVIDANAAF